MKFILQTLAIFAFAYVLALFTPWYGAAFAAFVMGYALRSKANFLAGFFGIGLLWLFKAWMIDAAAATDFAATVAKIFTLPQKNLLFVITACVGGMVGGFAALTGALLRPAKKKSYYGG